MRPAARLMGCGGGLLALLAVTVCCLLSRVPSAAGNTQQQQQQLVCSTTARANELPVFTSPAQVRALAEQFRADRLGGACPEEFAPAFEALERVLDERAVLGDICGPVAYERIRDFHTNFMHFYLPELSRDQLKALASGGGGVQQTSSALKPVPPALARFFITYAKQVTAACKQQLVARMKAEVLADKQLVDDQDMAVIEHYKRDSQRLGFLYEFTKMGLSSFGRKKEDDLNNLEVVDLMQAAADRNREGGEAEATNGGIEVDDGTKLYVQVRFDDRLRRIKEACLKRFMPIYQELFLPVIKLNNLGYIDHTHTRLEDKELRDNDQLHKWLDIIQTCEVLRDVEVLHDSSSMQALVGLIQDNSHLSALLVSNAAGADKKSKALRKLKESGPAPSGNVKIISRAEADALQAKVANSDEGEVRPLYDPATSHLEHQPLAFTPRLWLTEAPKCQREVDKFHEDLARVIKHKTSNVREWMANVKFQLKNKFFVSKNQIADRDQSSSLGRVAAFVERHKNLIKGVGVVLSIIMITTLLAG